MSYREILNLGIGGNGQAMACLLASYLALSAGNTLLGSTIGISPIHLQTMATIQSIINIVLYLVRGKIVDNTRTRWGRFRPYIAVIGFPMVFLSVLFVFLPFETMGYTEKLACVFAFAISISVLSPLLTDTYSELQTVISPNSEERTKILSVNSILGGVLPALTGLFIPILSNLTGGYTNISTYRWILAPISIAGVGLTLFTATGCKERVVTSATYVQKVGLFEGVGMIMHNKHWWLRTIAGMIGFLEGASGVLFSWVYIYSVQDMTAYGILNTAIGSASLVAVLITPFVLKKLGNKRLLILHNMLNIFFLMILIFTYKIPLFMFILFYMNLLVNSLATVYNAVMHSEVKDYQQYLCGKRMDFTFGAAGLVITPITICTGYVIPYVYEYMGLTTNYDILYNPIVRNKLFLVLCILSVVGAVMNLVPFCFYSMSKEKHQNIIRVLRYRALLEDYESGDFNPETVKNGVEAIRRAMELHNSPVPNLKLLKARYRELGASGDKAAAATAKKEWKQAIAFAADQAEVGIFLEEVNKFRTPEWQRRVAQASHLTARDVNEIAKLDASILKDAKALPQGSKEERITRKHEITRAKSLLKSGKKLRQKYPDGITAPDKTKLDEAFSMPDHTREEHKLRMAAIKEIEGRFDLYYSVIKPYAEAEKLVRNAETCKIIFAESEKRYDEACAIIREREEKENRKAFAKKAAKNAISAGKGDK